MTFRRSHHYSSSTSNYSSSQRKGNLQRVEDQYGITSHNLSLEGQNLSHSHNISHASASYYQPSEEQKAFGQSNFPKCSTSSDPYFKKREFYQENQEKGGFLLDTSKNRSFQEQEDSKSHNRLHMSSSEHPCSPKYDYSNFQVEEPYQLCDENTIMVGFFISQSFLERPVMDAIIKLSKIQPFFNWHLPAENSLGKLRLVLYRTWRLWTVYELDWPHIPILIRYHFQELEAKSISPEKPETKSMWKEIRKIFSEFFQKAEELQKIHDSIWLNKIKDKLLSCLCLRNTFEQNDAILEKYIPDNYIKHSRTKEKIL